MHRVETAFGQLSELPDVKVLRDMPLAPYTRFGIGGPADIVFETASTQSFVAALRIVRDCGLERIVIGGGTNLIVADAGFPGAVLKLTNAAITAQGTSVTAGAATVLQHLVDFTVEHGLKGLETMTGIPGSTGGAVYGNAGAYGHSLMECITEVTFFDGESICVTDNAGCEFHYRESAFKRYKNRVIFSARLTLEFGDTAALKQTADRILETRNRKYPPSMKCAGSIFKNYLLAELPACVAAQLPPDVIIEGKVPSAWFLEQVGAKGMRAGDIQVADYHANLIYNAGNGTARELREIIGDLKARVRARWDIPLEEEVQYVGF